MARMEAMVENCILNRMRGKLVLGVIEVLKVLEDAIGC
jgi:hypothetical protein